MKMVQFFQRRRARTSLRPLDFRGGRGFLLLGILTIGSCAGLETESVRWKRLPREIFGTSVEGRAIDGVVLGSGGETCLLLGVVHGNEPLGEPILKRLAALLAEFPEALRGRRVVIVPVVNPDGLAAGTRANAHGVDLNRNFPAQNWRASPLHGGHGASEPETNVVLKLIRQFEPRRVLAVHSPLECVNFDGPAAELAQRIASVTPYSVQGDIGYPTPGSLGSYLGHDLRTPTITLELGRGITEEEAWDHTHHGLMRFIENRDRVQRDQPGK